MSIPGRSPAPLFAPAEIVVEPRPDGSRRLRSPHPLGAYPDKVGSWLERWAREAPQRPFLCERGPDRGWRTTTYGAARDQVHAIATWLLGRDLSPERPVAILSENGVEHALLTLAAMHVGIPAAAISPAYSLLSKDFAKLRANLALLHPGLVFVDDRARYAPALAALAGTTGAIVVAGGRTTELEGATPFRELAETRADPAVHARFAAVDGDTIAKFLFTSGSIGAPKAVINTQRMLCSNQQALAQTWPFVEDEPPVIVDWLPWSHTFGANHNFNLVLRNGGTLYVDGGKPAPGAFAETLANLREVAPTIYFNVPRGFDLLVSALAEDDALARNFFRRLKLAFNAGAALPQHSFDQLLDLSRRYANAAVPVTGAWGSTETAPLATSAHFATTRSGVIGIPVPGVELKLVPAADKLEVRVRGPNVTPGYWKQPELTAQAFDDEGFYRIGDAVEFVDPAQPAAGLLFDGRVAEDFKLVTGTWVHVGTLRVAGLDALAPVAQDIVVTGHDRDAIGFLVFPNVALCRRLCAHLPADAPVAQLLADPRLRAHVAHGLAAMRAAGGGSSSYATRALLMAEPPSIDAGELTDKGYTNQRVALARRADLVARLWTEPPSPEVILPA